MIDLQRDNITLQSFLLTSYSKIMEIFSITFMEANVGIKLPSVEFKILIYNLGVINQYLVV